MSPAVPLARPAAPAVLSVDQLQRWFLDRPRRGSEPMVRVGNALTPYIEMIDYYKAAADAIEAAARPGGFVVIAGWSLDLDLALPWGSSTISFENLLARAGSRGAQVRVMLSGHLDHPNGPPVARINALTGCHAIADARLRIAASFHQKALVTSSGVGPIAFVGGMDFDSARLAKKGSVPQPPWHDVQVRIAGGGANDVLDTLALRWKTARTLDGDPLPALEIPLGQRVSGSKKLATQVVRTYGNPTSGMMIEDISGGKLLHSSHAPDLVDLWRSAQRAKNSPYAFAPQGDSSIHDQLVKAIRATQTSLYVEDQYFIHSAAIGKDNELLTALAITVAKPTFKQLIVLTCGVGTIQPELYQVNRRRRDLWNRIAALHPDRVAIWGYKAGQDRCYWVHTKTWIFDDTFALIGSANFNRRSLTADGELAVGVIDCEPTAQSNWVKDLRLLLWLKHLNAPKRPVTLEQIDDFASGSKLWIDSSPADLSQSLIYKLDYATGDQFQHDRLFLCDTPPMGWKPRLAHYAMCKVAPAVGVPLNTYDGQWELIDPDYS